MICPSSKLRNSSMLVPTWLDSISATVLSSSPCIVHRQGLHRRHQFCFPQGNKATPNLHRFIWTFDKVFLNFVAEFCFYHPEQSFVKMHKTPKFCHQQGSKARQHPHRYAGPWRLNSISVIKHMHKIYICRIPNTIFHTDSIKISHHWATIPHKVIPIAMKNSVNSISNPYRFAFSIKGNWTSDYRSAYKNNPEETKELQRKVDELMMKGYIRENMSPCVVLMLLVPKKVMCREWFKKSATINLMKMDEGWVWLCCLSFGV